jgi:hypothetical protein
MYLRPPLSFGRAAAFLLCGGKMEDFLPDEKKSIAFYPVSV